MNWRSCIRILARRGWVILFMIVLALMVTFVQNAAQKPVYRAVQRILLQPEQANSNSAQLIKYSPGTYTSWLSSLAHASQIVDALELDMAPHQLRATVSIDLDSEKALLGITVEMEDAAAAELIARTYGTNFIRWLNEQNQSRQALDRMSATLWDHPQLTTRSTLTIEVIALDTLIGALAGIVLVYGPAVFDNVIRRARSHARGPLAHRP